MGSMNRLYPVLVALVGLACVEESIEPNDLRPVDRVELAVPQAEVLFGDSLRLRAIGLASDGDTLPGRAVSWSSSDSAVILVTPGGLAIGVGTGEATITAMIEGRSDTASLHGVVLRFAGISAGYNHACGVLQDGSAWCWGGNRGGALGVGDLDLELSRSPRRVQDAPSLATIGAGNDATCGLTALGGAWCWGANDGGRLGLGTATDQAAPAPVVGGLTFLGISRPLGSHICGVTSGQAMYCWGANQWGQLGDGSRQDRSTPAQVQSGGRFASVSTGGDVSCGIDDGASAWCWGSDVGGRLGHDTTYVSAVPGPVSGGTGFGSIAANAYEQRSCGVAGGQVRCWGAGVPEPTVVPMPVPIVTTVLGEGGFACGLTAGGQAWCWGENDWGQLGNGSRGDDVVPPTPVAGGLSFVDIGAGWRWACGLVAAGDAYCWGMSWGDALGAGGYSPVPVLITGGLHFAQLTVEEDVACALDQAGAAHCWGANWSGEFGNGTRTGSAGPTPVSGGLAFLELAVGEFHACGITLGGQTYCWGRNWDGQLGIGSTGDVLTPTQVVGGQSFKHLSAGASHTCATDLGGTAYCWGANTSGQLGDGTTTQALQPIAVTGGQAFDTLVTGYDFTCGRTVAAAVYCWGDNHRGQLGNGVTTDSPVPLPVQGGISFVAVETGGTISCGRTGGGDTYCWPRQTYPYGQSAPVIVPGGVKFAQISVGGSHACGLTTSGAGYCWGRNDSGAFGDGSLNYQDYFSKPRAVSGGLSFAAISAGNGFTCGVTTAGTAYCWGANWSGQLGNALNEEAYQVLIPTKVRGQP